jgi:hypothetical protein
VAVSVVAGGAGEVGAALARNPTFYFEHPAVQMGARSAMARRWRALVLEPGARRPDFSNSLLLYLLDVMMVN